MKIALKKFLYTYWFYTIEEYLSQSWIKYCITRFYYSGMLIYDSVCMHWIVFKFCLGTLCTYFIDCLFWTDHISLYELVLSFICIIITNHYHMYLIVKTHFALCLLLSNDKFCIHSGGSVEYQISKWIKKKLTFYHSYTFMIFSCLIRLICWFFPQLSEDSFTVHEYSCGFSKSVMPLYVIIQNYSVGIRFEVLVAMTMNSTVL